MFNPFKFLMRQPYVIPEGEPEVTIYKRDFEIVRRKIDEYPGTAYFSHSKLRMFCIRADTLQESKDDIDFFLGVNGLYEEYRNL